MEIAKYPQNIRIFVDNSDKLCKMCVSKVIRNAVSGALSNQNKQTSLKQLGTFSRAAPISISLFGRES